MLSKYKILTILSLILCTTILAEDDIPTTSNQIQIAAQLDSIIYPTYEQEAILDAFTFLSEEQTLCSYNTMSGSQYTFLIPIARASAEVFKYSIYAAIRDILDPSWCPDPCERAAIWFVGTGGKYNVNGDDNCPGLRGTNWDLSVGIHGRLCNNLIVGIATNYQQDFLKYLQGGRTTRQTGQIATYALSRSDLGYFFGEAIYGSSTGRYKRPIFIGNVFQATAKSNPTLSQGLLYGEAGASFDCNLETGDDLTLSFLMQPFIAAQYGIYCQSRIREHAAGSLNLHINRHHRTNFDSLLGVHLTTAIWLFELSADLAWQHRFDPTKLKITEEFEDFGDSLTIEGCKLQRNGFIGNLRVAYQVTPQIDIFADVSTQNWGNWISYNVDFGFNAWW